MGLYKSRTGGVRPGAGRPKKRRSELQKTHSIRATDEEWVHIQAAVRTIKACDITDRQPRVLCLNDQELADVHRLLFDKLTEKRHTEALKELPLPDPSPAIQRPAEAKLEAPGSPDEEEAVSAFLEWFRLNPIEALSMAQAKLDREKRIIEMRRQREEQKEAMGRLERETDDVFQSIDDINERVAKMLQF